MAAVGRAGTMFRFRSLTPEQESAVKAAHGKGVRAEDLAIAYSVSTRAIYRAIHRADRERHEVVIGAHRAMFEIEDGIPIQVTPWVPA